MRRLPRPQPAAIVIAAQSSEAEIMTAETTWGWRGEKPGMLLPPGPAVLPSMTLRTATDGGDEQMFGAE